MEDMNSGMLTEQQKKDAQAFSQLPVNVRSHLLSYGAGMMAICGIADMAAKQAEKKVVEDA